MALTDQGKTKYTTNMQMNPAT